MAILDAYTLMNAPVLHTHFKFRKNINSNSSLKTYQICVDQLKVSQGGEELRNTLDEHLRYRVQGALGGCAKH